MRLLRRALLLIPSLTHALPTSPRLQLTAVVSLPEPPHAAALECWEFAAPFTRYPTVGAGILGLADVANLSYVVLPPRSREGLHRPPHVMFFALLAGTAHVTLPAARPGADDELWIGGDAPALVVAADTLGEGHHTAYPSDREAVALQIPFHDGVLPAHRVVRRGVCRGGEGLGLGVQELLLG